ncbi:MAG: NUDIX hydrolase [Myxococcales bacterium]|nr:NUDIX hydrolase [Myxococcales bacterium]
MGRARVSHRSEVSNVSFQQPISHDSSLGVAVDIVLLTVVESRLKVLLTFRDILPYENSWSLPGGFVGSNESADQAALRELKAKAGIEEVFLEQLYTFTNPQRDPRSRVVSVAYYALVSADKGHGRGGSRAAQWFDLGTDSAHSLWVNQPNDRLRLAFDHADILMTALSRIRGKLEYAPIGFQLLPYKFTLTELQQVFEAILGAAIDKRNFRAKIQRSGQIRALEEFRTGSHRPARLYTFEGPVF